MCRYRLVICVHKAFGSDVGSRSMRLSNSAQATSSITLP